MKILTLVWSIGIGGTERAAVNYAIGYKKFGEDSKVLVLGKGYHRYSDLVEAGVDTVLACESDLPLGGILNRFKQWGPDIIHIHNFNKSFLDYINILRTDHTKVVDTNVFSRPYYNADCKVVNLSMQLSQWGYWKYTRWMKNARCAPYAAIVPYIVDGERFCQPDDKVIQSFLRSCNIPKNAFVIGRIGQPHPSKWDFRIIDVIKKTIHPENNIYYLFVGVPENLKVLINRQSLFFKERVIQIEKIEGDENLSIYYYGLNCFAHISKIGESFGYVLAEALICKIPVISLLTPLNDNAQFEVIGNNYGGYCVTTVGEFIKKINLLYSCKEVHDTIKNNLRGWIETRYSYSAVISNQLTLYNKLLHNQEIPKIKVNDLVESNFDLYRHKISLMPLISKCINTSFFYAINQLTKTFRAKYFKLII